MVSTDTDSGGFANFTEQLFEPALQPNKLSKARKSASNDVSDAFGTDPFAPKISKQSAVNVFFKAMQLKEESFFDDDGEEEDLGWATDQLESDEEGSVYSRASTVLSIVEPTIKKISRDEFDWFSEVESEAEASVSKTRSKEKKESKKKKKERKERRSHKSSLVDDQDSITVSSEKKREKKSKTIKDGDLEKKKRRSKEAEEGEKRKTRSSSTGDHKASVDGDQSELAIADGNTALETPKRRKSKSSRRKATDTSVNSHETVSTHSRSLVLGNLVTDILETDGDCIEGKKKKKKRPKDERITSIKECKKKDETQKTRKEASSKGDKIDGASANTTSTTDERLMEKARRKAREQLALTPNTGGGKVKIKVKVARKDTEHIASPLMSPQSEKGTRVSLSSLFSRSSPIDSKIRSTSTIAGNPTRPKSKSRTSSAQTVCGSSPSTMRRSISSGNQLKDTPTEKSPVTDRRFGVFSPAMRIVMSPLTPKKPSLGSTTDGSSQNPLVPKSKLRDPARKLTRSKTK